MCFLVVANALILICTRDQWTEGSGLAHSQHKVLHSEALALKGVCLDFTGMGFLHTEFCAKKLRGEAFIHHTLLVKNLILGTVVTEEDTLEFLSCLISGFDFFFLI